MTEFAKLYESKGLTAMDVSREAKCSYALVLDLKQGKPDVRPRLDTLRSIAKAIGVTTHDVVRAIEGLPPKPEHVTRLCSLASALSAEQQSALVQMALAIASGARPA